MREMSGHAPSPGAPQRGSLGTGAWLLLSLPLVAFALAQVSQLTVQMIGWREADVLGVARNFCTEQAPIWLPRLDARGAGSGITGMEMPILNYLLGTLACAGVDPVLLGRAVTFACSLLAIGCVTRLGYKAAGVLGGLVSGAAFAFSPILLFFGRATQPDIPALALVLLGFVLFEASLPAAGPRRGWLFWAAAAIVALAGLIKIPAILVAPAFGLLLLERRGLAAFRELQTWCFALIAAGPPLAWHRYAKHLQDEYGIHYFFLGADLDVLVASWIDPSIYAKVFVTILPAVCTAPYVLAVALLGLALGWRRVPMWLWGLLGGAALLFLVSGPKSTTHFNYSMLWVAPIAIAFGLGVAAAAERIAGWLPERLPRRPFVGAVAAIAVLAPVRYGWITASQIWPQHGAERPYEEARAVVDGAVDAADRILLISSGDAKALWYLDRRAWIAKVERGGEIEAFLPRPGAPLVFPRVVVVDRDGMDRDDGGALDSRLRAEAYEPRLRGPKVEVWIRPDVR